MNYKTTVALIVSALLVPAGALPSSAHSTLGSVAVQEQSRGEKYVDASGNIIPSDRLAFPSGSKVSPGEGGREVNRALPAGGIFGCDPVVKPDDPHLSKGDVSAHGAWDKGDCRGDRAVVYNCLYEYTAAKREWVQKACSSRVTIAPGGGRGKRSTARWQGGCRYAVPTRWRNHVDVNVVGETDNSKVPYRETLLNCRTL